MIEDIIGYAAGFFIVISFIPQIIKSYKTKSVKDLSVWMIISVLIATILWIVYGFLVNGKPVIIVNIIFGLVVLYQLYLKIKYEK